MNALINRGSFLDDFFRDMAPGFCVKPFARRSSANTGPNQGGCEEGWHACTVQAEVPGVAKEDIHVSLDGNVVTLRAEVKQHDTQSRDAKVLRS